MYNPFFRVILICWSLSFTVTLSTAQNLGFYFQENRKKVTIPIEIHNNLIVIPVTINETNPLNFILDTGVRSIILVNRELTDTLGIEYLRKIQLYGVGKSTPVDAYVTGEISLSMPGIRSSGLSALVLERDFLQLEHHLGIRIHGLIGYDIFSRFVVKIDYSRKKIELYEPMGYSVDRAFESMELEIIDSKPVTRINLQLDEVNSIEATLLIDTGASHALVLDRSSSSEIGLPEKFIESKLGRGLTGEIDGYLGRIHGIQLGSKWLNGVITSFPDVSYFNSDTDRGRNGSIGGEMLKKFTVIFNFLHAQVYLKPNVTFKHPFEYNMSGLEFTAEGENLDRYVINEVRQNSSAHQVGFAAGDILVSVNNIPSKKLDLTKIYTFLNEKEGNKINLTVYRDGTYISRSFRLKREI